ncbi:alpha-ketoglutarate-dependent dioxygenase AlkB family protein [Wenyingzhuangia aestuarii]|uniref:alpha-ketoglutarate-dependent dioxygenase AlkB family protein n=1 Tax=Wenyingzhuangia aestuarii TaxID=1647582 RepID=UPI00143C5A70|nr:alpha-ketoglutarate-dependent dioxygenase AlkB [Wenyingzhuangia aestuarii]NJB82392.1 alkylated DNA repair dioxygenase AlkB [Wenyingzhuangia aestuarii]
MDLFNNTPTNLLPFDGEVYYYPNVISLANAQKYYQLLVSTIDWKNDEANLFGKRIVTQRKVALYGDSNFLYGYSNSIKQALPWTTELINLKKIAEEKCNITFNACLLNLYHNGNVAMGWHSDDEKALGNQPVIASISFGADRKFSFKHKTTKQTVSIVLEKGSLLIMKGDTQTNWLHKLPPTTLVKSPRINLTFRNINHSLTNN